MIKIDLITGFLGAGKTTFLKRYARYLLGKGQKIGIVVNDHGAVNVDMMLLGELEGENCFIEMVAGACDADCHRRRFMTKLIALKLSGVSRVLMEPSGVFDIDEFFDAIYDPMLDGRYEIGSVIAVVDGDLEEELSDSAEYLLASQVANAGMAVLSKTRNCSKEDIERTTALLDRALRSIGCSRSLEGAVLAKDWSSLDEGDFERIQSCGYASEPFIKRGNVDEAGFSSVYIMHCPLTADRLRAAVQAVFNDSACGNVFRVKGFVRDGGGWLELNATRRATGIKPAERGQEIIIVIGEALRVPLIKQYFQIEENGL